MPRKNKNQEPCTSKQALERDLQQRSVKEMLKFKRMAKKNEIQHQDINSESEDISLSIQIPPYLYQHRDIRTCQETYFVSIHTRVWYREHSNIDQVLNNYLEYKKIHNPNKEAYLNQMIRVVTSNSKSKRKYPFNEFKFNSIRDEIIGKELLMHRKISTPMDLEDTLQFYKENDIKLLAVDMTLNNDLYNAAKNFVEDKRNKHGSKMLYEYYPKATHFALEKYYRETDTQEFLELQAITVEELCEISTFEIVVRKDMENTDVGNEKLEICKKLMLDLFKENPKSTYSNPYFEVKPKYALIINNITPEQERMLTRSQYNFYKASNAKICLLQNKMYYESSKQDSVQREQERMEKFYLDYVRSKNRRAPPFNNLLWNDRYKVGKKTKTQPVLQEHNFQNLVSLEKDKLDCPSSLNPQKNQKVKLTLAELSDSSSEVIYDENIVKIIEYFFKDEKFVNYIKNKLRNEHPDTFKDYWKSKKKIILFNLLIKAIREEKDVLEEYISHCLSDNQIMINDIFFGMNLPLATSTQELEQPAEVPVQTNLWSPSSHLELPLITSTPSTRPPQSRPLQLDENSLKEILPMIPPISREIRVNPEKTVTIKEEPNEKLSSHSSQSKQDSSCMIVSQAFSAIITLDSDDEGEKQTTRELDGNDRIIDKYQRNMEMDSEALGLVSPTEDINILPQEQDELSQIEILYNPLDSIHHEEEVQTEEKNKEQKHFLRKRTSNSKSDFREKKISKKKGLEYLSETLGENGDDCNLSYNVSHDLNANFSIFLSTQVMLDHDRNLIESSRMTFTNPARSQIRDFRKICFLSELLQVIYKKDSMFEIIINIPQYSLNHIGIKNENIKEALNMNDTEWNTLLSNLRQLEAYEYSSYGNNRRQSIENQFERQIVQHLDLYFSSLTKFHHFHLRTLDGHSYEIQSSAVSTNALDLTDTLDEFVLKCIKTYKN